MTLDLSRIPAASPQSWSMALALLRGERVLYASPKKSGKATVVREVRSIVEWFQANGDIGRSR